MKLLRCYIENFGVLHQYALEFQPGLTVIKAPNGFGKTTLAAFLRCMFYGLPRANRNALRKDLRRKYAPWQGGTFGGNLEFELEGREYRVERGFGDQPSQDTFALYEQPGLRKSRRFTKNLGVELFGLDGESFERSTYLPQLREIGPLSTDNIQAKLGNLVEDSNDINRYEKAVEALRKARSAYIPYRGSGGSVEQAGRRVTQLQRELEDCRLVREGLPEEYRSLAALEGQIRDKNSRIAETQRRIAGASAAEARRALCREYQGLMAGKAEIEEAGRRIAGRYPKGLPKEAELSALSNSLDQLAAVQGEEADREAWQEAQAVLNRQKGQFDGGLPAVEELDACQSACEEYISLTARLQGAGLSDEERRELEELEDFFRRGVPSPAELEDCQRRLSRAAALGEENSRLAADGAGTPPVARARRGKRSKGLVLCLLAGGLAALSGIILLAARRYGLGGGLLGIGALCLIGAVYGSLRRLIAESGSGQDQPGLNPELQRRILANQMAAQGENQAVREFVSSYLGPECGPQEGVNLIRGNLARYQSLTEKRNALAQREGLLRQRRDALEEKLRAFLGRYGKQGAPEEFGQQLANLRGDYFSFQQARGTVERIETRRHLLEAERNRNEEAVEQFFHRYELTGLPRTRGGLQAIRDDLREARELESRYRQVAGQISRFTEEHGADFPREEPSEAADLADMKREVEELSREVQALNETLAEERQRVARLQEQADRVPELSDQLDSWREQRETGRKKAELLDKTLAYLERARQSLSETYLEKIRRHFTRYLNELLPGEDGGGVFLSHELEVSLERGGKARELGYFSAGYADLVMLCMRLALVESLFEGEKPFLILDDPFVNLDDENTERALALLRRLGEERQILYLVCNSGRC